MSNYAGEQSRAEYTRSPTSALEPSPGTHTPDAVMVAMSHDGRRALVTDGVRLADGPELLRGVRASALALVDREAWVVIEEDGEHALRRFDAAGAPAHRGAATRAIETGRHTSCSLCDLRNVTPDR